MLKYLLLLLFTVIGFLSSIGIVDAASNVLCSQGDRYPTFGGCCGDGITDYGEGEECDAGFSLNNAHDLAGCYSNCNLRPYVYKNFTNVENCQGQPGYTVGGYCIFDDTPMGGVPYIMSDQTHRCNGGNVEMVWNRNSGTGYGQRYVSAGTQFYDAACRSPSCNNVSSRANTAIVFLQS